MSIRTGMKCGALAAGLMAAAAQADVIDLNVPTSSFGALTPVVTGRVRFDAGGGVDQLLFKQPTPNGYPASDLLRMNSTFIGTASYTFTVTHNAATREYVYSLTNGSVTGGASFANANAANNTQRYTPAAGELSYNILHIFMLSSSGATASFSNMVFTPGAGLTTTGAVQAAASVTSGSYDQWFAAPTGTNLENFDWTVSADVTLAMNGVRPSSEGLKFELTGKSGEYVPTPGAASVLAVAGLAALRRRR